MRSAWRSSWRRASVVAVYWLGLVLWGSPLAALLGATVFASFRSFALTPWGAGREDAGDPLRGAALALLVRRRWFWGALAGSLAVLVWQLFAVYVLVAVGAAFIGGRWGGVRDAVAGAAIRWRLRCCGCGRRLRCQRRWRRPCATAEGVERVPETLGERIARIAGVVASAIG